MRFQACERWSFLQQQPSCKSGLHIHGDLAARTTAETSGVVVHRLSNDQPVMLGCIHRFSFYATYLTVLSFAVQLVSLVSHQTSKDRMPQVVLHRLLDSMLQISWHILSSHFLGAYLGVPAKIEGDVL